MTGKLVIVVGGQFGSEGKGAAAARLASTLHNPLVIRTGGPNAGHTVVGPDGAVHKLRQLPTAAISTPTATLALSGGSLIDLEVLEKELIATGAQVMVDEAATILEPRHLQAEETDPGLQWGSTRKGIGAARADRLMRRALVWGTNYRLSSGVKVDPGNVADVARQFLKMGSDVLIETAQGYGLGLHTRFYPKTTSADCRAIDALADVGLSPWEFDIQPEVWVVVRPYPIRVAGDSGPLYQEVTWEKLGLPEERTTVTNKVRRVGLWDSKLVADAIRANGGAECKVWFSMADQVVPELQGMRGIPDLARLSDRAKAELFNWSEILDSCGAEIWALGTGPATSVLFSDYYMAEGGLFRGADR